MTASQSAAISAALDGARAIESLDPVAFYAGQIRSALHRLAPAHMETAGLVAQARAALDHASFRALRAGELDDLFAHAAKTGVIGKPRKAA